LAQNHRPLEIIVIDDGSTDESADIAQAYAKRELNVHYLHQLHRGIGAARNRGIAHAKGCYLAFLDADDLWCADKLTQFVSPELSDEQKRELRCPSDPMPGYLATAMLVPREVFHRVGLFETSLRVGEFLHWYLRAMELQLDTIMLPDVVMRRRIHTSNQGRRERDARTDYAHVLKAAMDRRRAAADDIPRS
jgi:glycosyltransferase involved in cell wall biosynthesis